MEHQVTVSAPATPPSDAGIDLTGPLIVAFLSGRSERTLRAYRQDLEDFRSFSADDTIAAAAAGLLNRGHGGANSHVLAYRAHLRDRGLKPATVNRRLAALRSLVRLARLTGHINWTLDVENVRSEAYRDTRGPGADSVRRMIASLDGAPDRVSRRNHAALRLLCDLGMRRGEVVSLDVEDVDLVRGTIEVTGKGRDEKHVMHLAPATSLALASWMEARGSVPGPLFLNFDRAGKGTGRLSGTSLYRIVRELGATVGERVRPHGLRHTAITEAVKLAQENGMNLEEVMDLSRHRDVRVLMVYRDRERNVQGQLSQLLADRFTSEAAPEPD